MPLTYFLSLHHSWERFFIFKLNFMNNSVYLDYAATTPVDKRVAEKMFQCLTLDGTFGNPASKSHAFGWQAAELVDIARNDIANLIGADSREIIFTSGTTGILLLFYILLNSWITFNWRNISMDKKL